MTHPEVLPPAQRALWDGPLGTLPAGWVLYGGTAIALHLGHRQSLDFDFFSSARLDRPALRRACSCLAGAKTLQDEPETLTVVVEETGDPVKISFFGGIDFGRVGEPVRTAGHPPIASALDLLGTKLATVTQRIEARDYEANEGYRFVKEQVTARVLAQAERAIPGLARHIVFREAATPLTHVRYTRSTDGTSYGISATPAQFLAGRPQAATPSAGLYLAGASTRAGHGIVGAMTSGVLAADAVLRDGTARRVLGGA